MFFGAWFDAEGNWFDTIHFPHSFQYTPFKGRGCYLIQGKVIQEFGFQSIEVSRCERLPIKDRKDPDNTQKAVDVLANARAESQRVA